MVVLVSINRLLVTFNIMTKINFKNENSNTWKTRTMFVDILTKSQMSSQPRYVDYDSSLCPYWLSERWVEGDPRPILRELFIELRDMTGTKLAKKHLGGWQHLAHLMKSPWFKAEWDKWQEELFMEIQADSLDKIAEIAAQEGATALSAAKFLANKEWEKAATSKKRGRPSKEEVDGALKQEVKKVSDARKDYERMLNMTVIQGGRA